MKQATINCRRRHDDARKENALNGSIYVTMLLNKAIDYKCSLMYIEVREYFCVDFILLDVLTAFLRHRRNLEASLVFLASMVHWFQIVDATTRATQ